MGHQRTRNVVGDLAPHSPAAGSPQACCHFLAKSCNQLAFCASLPRGCDAGSQGTPPGADSAALSPSTAAARDVPATCFSAHSPVAPHHRGPRGWRSHRRRLSHGSTSSRRKVRLAEDRTGQEACHRTDMAGRLCNFFNYSDNRAQREQFQVHCDTRF